MILAAGLIALTAPRLVFCAEPVVAPAVGPTARPAAPPNETQIEAWIAGLADEDQATRRTSRQSLIDAGAPMIPRLQKELEKNDADFETRLTLKLILDAIPKSAMEYSLVHGTDITLDLQDATFADALHSIESQCNISFAGLLERHANLETKQTLKFRGTYWEALHKIAVAYAVAGIFESGKEPVAVAGPGCLRLVEMSFKKNMRTGEESIEVSILQAFEPMVDSSEFALTADSIVANGKPLKEVIASCDNDGNNNYNRNYYRNRNRNRDVEGEGDQEEAEMGFVVRHTLSIPYPKEGLKSLSIGGTIHACLSDRKGRKEINPKKDAGKSYTLGAADFLVTSGETRLEKVLKIKGMPDSGELPEPPIAGTSAAMIGLILTHDSKEPIPAFLERFESNLQFLGDDGKPQNCRRYNAGNGQVNYNGRSIAYYGVSFCCVKECTKIVLQYPLVVKHVSIPFNFENVPLPERGN